MEVVVMCDQKAVKVIKMHDGGTYEIHIDTDPMNPREEFDNIGIMSCWHRRYNLGDTNEAPPNLSDEKAIWLPLYLYDHGGITMQTTPLSCPWDSGRVGTIYVMADKIKEEFDYDLATITDEQRRHVLGILVAEVLEYAMYLGGDVYGYIRKDKDGDEIESCWGFYGLSSVLDEVESMNKKEEETK
jgi:hypothetical protein